MDNTSYNELDSNDRLYLLRLKNGTTIYAIRDNTGEFWRTADYGTTNPKVFRDRSISRSEIEEILTVK